MASRKDALIACALFLGFLGIYARTLCPTVYLGDAGDFCTAMVTGGVPHPPGYPLFCLLGRVALAVIPWGEPAFRIGCVVAVAAAGAVATLFFLARALGCSSWAAATGAGVFGGSYTFWSQSTRVEVYSIHVLLAGLLLLASFWFRRTGRLRWWAAAVVAGSLGLAHHLTIVLLGPAVLAICGRRLRSEPALGRRLAVLCALLPIGPAAYLLLLVWARAGPLHAWGHTVTLPLLWNHASAHIFRIFLEMPDSAHVRHTLGQMAALFSDSFPYLLFLVPLVGAAALWKRDRVAAVALLLVMVVVAAYNVLYRIPDIAVYYLPAWMAAAVLLAVGLDALGTRAPESWRTPGVAGAVFCLLLALPLARNWRACDLSAATWVRDLARNKLESADPGSVLITQGDSDVNPIWYAHDVLGIRPDVLPIDRPSTGGRTWGLYDWDPSLWYLRRLRLQGVDAPLDVPQDRAARSALARDGYLIRLLTGPLRDRPLCVTFAAGGTPLFRWVSRRFDLLPVGIVLRLHPKERRVDLPQLLARNEQLWSRITLPDLREIRTDEEIAPDYVGAHYACMLVNFGGLYELAGDRDRAASLYRRAADWAPRYAPATAALVSLRRAGIGGHPSTPRGQG